MLGEPRSSLLERALEALPAAPARGAHGLALPSLDELVDFDRWLLVAPDVGALSQCARTLRFSQTSRSGQSRRRGRTSKDLCSAAVRSKAAVIAHRRVPAVWLGLLRPTTQTRAAGQRERAARLEVALGAVACSPPTARDSRSGRRRQGGTSMGRPRRSRSPTRARRAPDRPSAPTSNSFAESDARHPL
jgi:hypothetical protein